MSLKPIKYLALLSLISLSLQKGIFDYSHQKNDKLSIQVGSITSIKNVLPFSYYKLGICKPERIQKVEDTLGEIISGEKIYQSSYEIFMGKDEYCKTLCVQQFDDLMTKNIEKIYKKQYVTNWFLDKLPAGLISHNTISNTTSIDYSSGIPIGFHVTSNNNSDIYIYNHYQFRILIHPQTEDTFEIVGFNILPLSIKQDSNALCAKSKESLMDNFRKDQQKIGEGRITFTYDVIFENSNLTMASRWDHYNQTKKSIHWIGIVAANIILFFLSFLILAIFCNGIEKDVEVYNVKVTKDDFIDESGWKQVSNDVFRPGKDIMLFCAVIGTGIQLFFMLFFCLFLSVIGFMKPEQRGNLLSLLILYYVIMGFPAGYTSSKFYRLLNGEQWLKASILTALLFPGVVFIGYSIINVILVMEKSSAAVNFLDIFSLLILWICCAFPLTLIGSFCGIKSKILSIPCKVNPVPTYIPDKPWYFKFKYTFWIAGLITFSTVFIEFIYLMASLWQHQIYFLATFLWIGSFLLITVSLEVAIILIYINLCNGDYIWWWKSFFFGGSSAVFVIIYSVYYFFFSMIITRLSSMVIYFGLMGLISLIVFLMCGAVSAFGTFAFLQKIYSLIKVD